MNAAWGVNFWTRPRGVVGTTCRKRLVLKEKSEGAAGRSAEHAVAAGGEDEGEQSLGDAVDACVVI